MIVREVTGEIVPPIKIPAAVGAVVDNIATIYAIGEAMEGKTFSEGPTDHNSKIVKNGESLEDQLPSPTVTKENADDKSFWGNA